MSLDLQRIDKMDGRINQRGADLFFDDVAVKHGAELGVDNFLVLYGAGRAGVMGDVTAAQACSAFAFFDPGLVQKMWSSMEPEVKPSAVAQVFAAALATAARERWDEAAAAEVAGIGRKVADSINAIGMPLFVGWRDVPVPDDPIGAATMTVMTLRELRGDIHIQSVSASGVAPLQADFFTRGEQGVQMHGWQPPYPDVAHHADAMAAAQASTSARMGRIYEAALTTAELDAFDEAVRHLRKR
jgi:helix-turn-helix protein